MQFSEIFKIFGNFVKLIPANFLVKNNLRKLILNSYTLESKDFKLMFTAILNNERNQTI